MQMIFSPDNPFRETYRFDHAYVWEVVSRCSSAVKSLRLLDYGCNDGTLIATLVRSFPNVTVVGVDKNSDAVGRGMQRFSASRMSLQSPHDLVAWLNTQNDFDIVLAMGVIEHVVEQDRLLKRLGGTLKPEGTMIVSVPGKNFFSWADFGNWKFYFPRIHRWYVTRTKGADFYRTRFVDCANGLFGDVEIGKECHQHFRRRDIESLVETSGCRVVRIDGYGFFFRVLHNLWWFSPKFLKPLLMRWALLDLRLGSSAELVVEARR